MSLLEPEMIPNDGLAFALPDEPETDAPRRKLPAADALEMLRRGETLENVHVDRLRLAGLFAHPVRMVNVSLRQPRFDGATFAGELRLHRCALDRPRFQRRTVVGGDLTLTGSTLTLAEVCDLTVKGKLHAGNVQSRGKLLFRRCRFEESVSFWEANFRGWVEFRECDFLGEADLRSFHAHEGFTMTRCRCAGDVLFRGAHVTKKWDGQGTRFEALLDFSKAKLNDFVYLEGIEQGDKQRFAFANALAERFQVRTGQLVGRLASEEKDDHDAAMSEYALLKRSFGTLHRFDQEDWAYYRFKLNQRRGAARSWLRPWTRLSEFLEWLFLDHGCGYGTNPYRALRTGALIILLFGLLYAARIDTLPVEKMPFDGEKTTLANRAVVGVFTSVSVFTSGLSGIRDAARGWMNVPLIVEALLGTLLWGLFVVAFSRKVIR